MTFRLPTPQLIRFPGGIVIRMSAVPPTGLGPEQEGDDEASLARHFADLVHDEIAYRSPMWNPGPRSRSTEPSSQ